MHEVTNTDKNSSHRANTTAVATIWLVFYVLAVVVAIVPSMVSYVIEVAAR
jgi:hypothetical protein